MDPQIDKALDENVLGEVADEGMESAADNVLALGGRLTS